MGRASISQSAAYLCLPKAAEPPSGGGGRGYDRLLRGDGFRAVVVASGSKVPVRRQREQSLAGHRDQMVDLPVRPAAAEGQAPRYSGQPPESVPRYGSLQAGGLSVATHKAEAELPARWQQRSTPQSASVTPVAPPDAMWAGAEGRMFSGAAASGASVGSSSLGKVAVRPGLHRLPHDERTRHRGCQYDVPGSQSGASAARTQHRRAGRQPAGRTKAQRQLRVRRKQ